MSTYIEVIMDWLDLYELRNFGIHSDKQKYAQKISTSERFSVEAKTNITEGEALEITLSLHKKSSDIITKTYETHVTNGAISDKFKIEDLASEEDMDINDIAAISAVAHYEDQEFKSNLANITRVLQSKQLKESGVLNDIVEKRVNKVFKKTTPLTQGEEVKRIQKALQRMKIDIGNDGIDGKFGNDGESAVKTFQANYTPTHTTHQYDWAESPDGVVGRNTLLAMDEALVEGWEYQNQCYCDRDISAFELKNILGVSNLFSANNCLLLSSEKNYEKLALELNKTMKAYDINTCLKKVHFLAQCAHESANFQTTSEFHGSSKSYAPYYGRGLLQLTHGESNYKKYSTYKNINFKENPNLIASKLENSCDVSGWFWTKGCAWGDLNIYADKDDLIQVSIAVNGGLNGFDDRKAKLKSYTSKMKIKENCKHCSLIGVYKYSTSHIKNTRYGHAHKNSIENLDD